MANTRKLAGRVSVGGRWYGPGPVPDDIAARITNPKAWATDTDDTDSGETVDDSDREAGTSTGARLAGRVTVGGRWYGPDDPVPDDIAARITNPKAWEGGVLPTVEGSDTAVAGPEDTGQVDETPEPTGQQATAELEPESQEKPTRRTAGRKS